MGGELALDLSTLPDNADLVLIENTGSTALVSGTFAGLPEGTTFLDSTGTRRVTITYAGIAGLDGIGNDILLTNIIEEVVLQDGDFDGDLDVDGADFLAWQRGGSPSASDLADWQANFGEFPLPGLSAVSEPSAAVPEPATWVLLSVSLVGGAVRRLRVAR